MRVAVVLEQCWHRVPGGTARAALEQVCAVAETRRVDQVGVAALHRRPPPEPWRPAIRVRHLPLPRKVLYESWNRVRRPGVERFTGRVDVIHATGYAVPPRTSPLVVTLHDVAWRRDPSNFTPNGVQFLEGALTRTREDADLVLCPSSATLDDCAAAGIEQARLRLIPWGIAAEVATDDAVARTRSRYGLTGRYILYVGTLEPRKNLRRLLDAFGRLPHDDVVLAVVGPQGWGDALGQPASALGDRVKLLGFVAPDDLAPLNRGAAVVCYPSLWEGYGLPVAEALAQGAAVVTSKGTATEDLVEGGAGLAVDPYDPDAIAGALADVLNDVELAERLRAAALRRAAERTWADTAAQTIAAYEWVVAR
ncbi:MAG: glycosyltransferase family 4 protein [Acidimicrobiales bacterium]